MRREQRAQRPPHPGTWVHHVRLGLKLKEAMDKLDIECVVTDPENSSEDYEDVHDFIIRKLQ